MPKAEFKLKKSKRKRKFIKDKAVINFLLEHMKPVKIDFSKIKIPSYLNFQKMKKKNKFHQMNRMKKKFSKIFQQQEYLY